MKLQVKSLKLRDRKFDNWFTEVEDKWDYEDFLKDEAWRKDWISFDCLCYVDELDTVYLGITSFDADIFWSYSRKEREFVSIGYERVANRYDAKFHRSLVYYDGYLYGAIALLHDVDRWLDAPGGAIVRYNPKTGEIEKLGVPIEHHYIQAIVLDKDRGVIYGQTFTPERFFAFDIETKKSVDLGPIGSGLEMGQGENLAIDDKGNVWGGWNITRAWQPSPGVDSNRLFRYNVKKGKIEYLKVGLPRPDGSYGYVKPEGFFNLGDGYIYVSGGNGSVYRVDIESLEVKYLFTPVSDRRSRLADIEVGPDGYGYGVVGRDGRCELMRFDFRRGDYELVGEIVDDSGEHCWQVHDVEIASDGVIYAGENDVPTRSGYLWEIKIEEVR